jgi:hypothetical protein
VQKTEQGKLGWKPTADENAFICVLEGEFTFRIVKFVYEGDDRCVFSMTDKANNEIFADSGSPGGFWFRKLAELHEVARRSALDVEDKVNKVTDILKRI